MSPWTHVRYVPGSGTFKEVVSSMQRRDPKISAYQHREITRTLAVCRGSELGAEESLGAILNHGSLIRA